MTGTEAITWIDSFQWQKQPPGLDRIRTLLRLLGDPQEGQKYVHTAGTNGKGSTCAMLAAILQQAGYRTGLNTSPHLLTFHERIRVDGELISDGDLAALTAELQRAASAMEAHPTEFELITALALLYFRRRKCDIAVLEAGLGGELDASNVIGVPEAAVLTAMGMDHTAILGPTQTDIARAKAGIIKPGGQVVSLGGCPEADAVFRETCRDRGAFLTEVDRTRLRVRSAGLEGSVFDFGPWKGLKLALPGQYQTENAAAALTTVEVLRRQGWEIPDEAVRVGLRSVRWPGRLEVLGREPLFLLDGAHNAHGVRAAAESIRALLPGRKLTLLLGVLADKDFAEMLDLLAPLAERAFALRPDSPRALGAEELCGALADRGVDTAVCGTVEEGVSRAVAAAGPGGAVCALGSLYFSADIREAYDARRRRPEESPAENGK